MSTASSRSSWYGLALLAFVVLVADQASKIRGAAIHPTGLAASCNSRPHQFCSHQQSRCRLRAPRRFADALARHGADLVFDAVIALLLWLLASGRAGGRLAQLGLTLILGGAAGNVLDRVTRHSVTDFIDFHIRNYHWYTFNVADSAIVVGAALVVLELFFDWRHPTQERVS